MHAQRQGIGNVGYMAVLVAGAAVTAFHLTLGLYHLAFIAAAMTAVGLGVMALEQVTSVARLARPELTLLARVPIPATLATVRVTHAAGACAWGYSAGQSWSIDARGTIAPQLCRAAVTAVTPLLQHRQSGGATRQVACTCPLANRQVAFAVS